MKKVILILTVIVVLALYMLIVATGSTNLLARYYWQLFTLNTCLVILLFVVLIQQFWKLWHDSRDGVFGTKLTKRLINAFAWITILPALFLFTISGQFINHTINSWFGNDTEEALERSLSLSKLALENSLKDTVTEAAQVQIEIIRILSMEEPLEKTLIKIKEMARFDQVIVLDVDKQKIVEVLPISSNLPIPNLKDLNLTEVAKSGIKSSNISLNNKLYAEVWMRVPKINQNRYLLLFRQLVPKRVSNDVMLIENARAKYAELSFSKQGLQIFFMLTLVIATLLAILLALTAAIFFAKRFIAPLMSLANATKAVSQGDFSVRSPIYKSDELGILSAQFNRMTEQLQQSKLANEKLYREQEEAKYYLEQLLSGLMTGVLTLDASGKLIIYNQAAESILNFQLGALLNKQWSNWDENYQQLMLRNFVEEVLKHKGDENPVRAELGIDDKIKILLGKAEDLDVNQGIVVIFDDITELVMAQKEAAWGEVARRLAHEIRNPLTPIQLSAERISWKLGEKLNPEDAEILHKSTGTIIKQVGALKEMVEGFKNYARAAKLKFKVVDLNEIVKEVLVLYEGSDCIFAHCLSSDTMNVKVDSTSIRQVLHNIFKNAAEATIKDENPRVVVTTFEDGQNIVLLVENSGQGFAPDIIKHVFEPYITNKREGTGLGLSVVKKIIDEHDGKITVGNRDSNGAWVKITLPKVK